MILSPIELDILKGMLVEKEEKPKSRNKCADFTGTIEMFTEAVNAVSPINHKLEANSSHLKTPKFTRKDETRYELEIELKRESTTKELISGTTHRSGLLVVNIEDNKVNVKAEYTSKETKNYLLNVMEGLNYQLLKQGCIKQNLKGIKFSDFLSNQKRSEFLTSFKDVDYSSKFFKGQIVNIKFKPDENVKVLPPSLEDYRGIVRNLDINGSTLERLSLVLDEKNQNCILLSRVKLFYNFDLEGNQGKCIASISFPSTLNGKEVDTSNELEVSVEVLKDKASKLNWGIPRLQKRISRELDKIVVNKYYSKYSIEPATV